MVQCLIASGAQLDLQNKAGNTPLHIAIAYENPDVVKALLAAGARTDVVNVNGKIAPAAKYLAAEAQRDEEDEAFMDGMVKYWQEELIKERLERGIPLE